MNQIKLVLSSLLLVVLAACGGRSDSDSTDAEFLKVSAELRQTLPEVDESLSSLNPEGIWRIASHSVSHISIKIYNEGNQENSDLDFESSSQLLVIIQKGNAAGNAYVIYMCDGYRSAASWKLNGNTLSNKIINDDSVYFLEQIGNLVLNDNLSLVGQDNYKYNGASTNHQASIVYAGVKISDSISFEEAQNLNIDLQINQKDASYQLSDYVINPSCFSIRQDEGEFKEYSRVTETNNTYNQSGSSFVIEMMSGNRASAYEEIIVVDAETSVINGSYSSDVNTQNFQMYNCSVEMETQNENCLESFTISTSTETNAMSASSKGESIAGEAFEVSFSYSQE
jgi:hypothetical protein